jgi:4-hydroxy-tetrahydrodipicolinate synthase
MKNVLFTGVCTALVTPFVDGKVNYPLLEMLLKRQLEAGIKAVVLAGTTGEASTLSDEEKLEIFRRGKAYVGDQMTVIAGTGSNDTAHAVELSKKATQTGVDGLLVVSPYYNKATDTGLIAHYSAIAGAVQLPVIVYNVPGRTGVDIPVPVYKVLSQIPNIAGVKEASGSISKIAKIKAACGCDLPIWSGNDDMIAPILSLGGAGVISVLSNVVPKQTRYLTEAALDGDFDTAAALQCQLMGLIDLLFSEVNPVPVKQAMKLIGYDCGPCRLPLTDMKPENLEKLRKILG